MPLSKAQKQTLKKKVVEVISGLCGVPVDRIEDSDHLINDLGMYVYSIQALAQPLTRIAREFNESAHPISRGKAKKLKKVKAAVKLCTDRAEGKR